MKTLCDYPEIILYEGFLSDEECVHIIEMSKDNLVRSQVDGNQGGVTNATRTSSQAWLQHNTSPMIEDMCERIADAVGIPLENAEPIQTVYYRIGQEYHPHHDAYDLNTTMGKRATQGWGQRVKTALLYLNDVEMGGETEFPYLDIRVKPKRGDMVVFQNIDLEVTDVPLYNSMHAALPVERGFKWACNLWFHERSNKFQGQDHQSPVHVTQMSDEECIKMLETIATATKHTYGEHSKKIEFIARRFQELLRQDESKFK